MFLSSDVHHMFILMSIFYFILATGEKSNEKYFNLQVIQTSDDLMRTNCKNLSVAFFHRNIL